MACALGDFVGASEPAPFDVGSLFEASSSEVLASPAWMTPLPVPTVDRTDKDNVHFNYRLIKAPMFVIDYVIAHELAHLIEVNYTPRFRNIVRTQVPRMEKAKTWLRENGQILEEDV